MSERASVHDLGQRRAVGVIEFSIVISLGRFAFAVTPFVACVVFVACSESREPNDLEPGNEGGIGGEVGGDQGGASGSGTRGGTGGGNGVGGSGGEGNAGATGTGGTSDGGESGESGSGGAGGDAGRGGAGKGGRAGAGGSAGVVGSAGTNGGVGGGGAGTSGSAGTAASAGMGAGTGGGAGAGGTGGQGVSGTGSDGGSGGRDPNCIEVTATTHTDFVRRSVRIPRVAIFEFGIAPALGSSSFRDTLEIQFFSGGSSDGARTGAFSLGRGTDSNYATCSRCLLAVQDRNAPSAKTFFQTTGTLTLAASSQQMDGFPTLTYADVTLREVTIDGAGHSTLVPNGVCLYLVSGSYSRPPVWSCPPSWRTDGQCDCGCATPDPECENSNVSSCDWCWCGDGDCPSFENPTKNWTCL